MSTNRRIEKLFLFIKWNATQQEREWIADTDKSMDEPHRHCVVWKKPKRKCPDVNYMYRGDYSTTHINIKPLPCTPETNVICQLYLNIKIFRWQFSSVQFSRSVVSDSLRPHELQHARPPCPSPSPGVHSDSRSSSTWCHSAISSLVVPFFSCPQSLPASESLPMCQFFSWGGQSTGASALPSFLPKKSQGWSPSDWTDWISLQSKGPSRVFSNTTVQKHQFFGAQPSS